MKEIKKIKKLKKKRTEREIVRGKKENDFYKSK